MSLMQVIYASTATHPFSKDDLKELLAISRANNQERKVSGLLLYKDGNFLQVLEGEEDILSQLLRKIDNDPRHFGMMVYSRREIVERDFPDWSMAFRDLDDPNLVSIPGYNEFLNTSLADKQLLANSPRVRNLVSVFAESIR